MCVCVHVLFASPHHTRIIPSAHALSSIFPLWLNWSEFSCATEESVKKEDLRRAVTRSQASSVYVTHGDGSEQMQHINMM